MESKEETWAGFRGEYDFLSNFYMHDFFMKEFGGIVKSGEHAYGALKTSDANERLKVLDAKTPQEAKRIGRGVTLLKNWDKKYRLPAMTVIVNQKFNVPELSHKLIETEGIVLVEYNYWHDLYFGRCICPNHDGSGENMLGKLLMKKRFILSQDK